jgi:hypothetical protein
MEEEFKKGDWVKSDLRWAFPYAFGQVTGSVDYSIYCQVDLIEDKDVTFKPKQLRHATPLEVMRILKWQKSRKEIG